MDIDGGEVLGLVGEFKNKTGLQCWQSQRPKRTLKSASDHCQAAKDLVPPIISNLAWTWKEERGSDGRWCSDGDGAQAAGLGNGRGPAPRLRWRIIITMDLERWEKSIVRTGKGSDRSLCFMESMDSIFSCCFKQKCQGLKLKAWHHQGNLGLPPWHVLALDLSRAAACVCEFLRNVEYPRPIPRLGTHSS